jgi:hypothetical protein
MPTTRPHRLRRWTTLALGAWLVWPPAWAAGSPDGPVSSTSDPLTLGSAKPAPGRGQCKNGFVWREARRGDTVCVLPATRDAVALQNRQARRLWVNGAEGPRTCVSGHVWREAFDGDTVCVRPAERDATQADNAQAVRRRVK